MPTIFIIFFFLALIRASIISSHLTDQFFSQAPDWFSVDSNGNSSPISSIEVCGQVSLLAGITPSFQHLTQTFISILPHLSLQLSFELYLIDANIPQDLSVSVSAGQFQQELTSQEAITLQLCGSNTQETVWRYSTSIIHSSSSLVIDIILNNAVDNTKWGIRDVVLSSTQQCYQACSSCSSSSQSGCLTCYSGQPDSNGKCAEVSNQQDSSVCDLQIEQSNDKLLFVKQSDIIQKQNNENNVEVLISYNLDKTSISSSCRSSLVTKAKFLNSNNELQPFPDSMIQVFQSTQELLISFPLSQIESYSHQFNKSANQTTYTLSIIIFAENSNKKVRDHSFELIVIQNGETTIPFLFDSDPLQSNCVQPINNCNSTLTVVDLDIQGNICQNDTCNSIYQGNTPISKIVGDYFIVKLEFKDKSYTKKLLLNKVIFKAGNSIVDLSPFSEVLFNDNSGVLIVRTVLIEQSQAATIQYNLSIDVSMVGRFLQTNVKQQISPFSYQAEISVISFSLFLVNQVMALLIFILI